MRWEQQSIISNYLKSSNKDLILFMKVASTKIWVIKLDILGPIRPILGHCQLQPWFHVPVIVNHCCILNVFPINTRIISKSKHVPRLV